MNLKKNEANFFNTIYAFADIYTLYRNPSGVFELQAHISAYHKQSLIITVASATLYPILLLFYQLSQHPLKSKRVISKTKTAALIKNNNLA